MKSATRKILLIDDSTSVRYVIRGQLPQELGLDVFEAANGRDGLALFKEVSPDLVLLDLTMPVMDGYETLGAIRKLSETAPVIVLTADMQKKTTERVMQLGATNVMRKPPNREQLRDIIQKCI